MKTSPRRPLWDYAKAELARLGVTNVYVTVPSPEADPESVAISDGNTYYATLYTQNDVDAELRNLTAKEVRAVEKYSEEARLHIENKLHTLLTEAHKLGVQVESVFYDEKGEVAASYSISADEIGRFAEAAPDRKHPEPLLVVNIDRDA